MKAVIGMCGRALVTFLALMIAAEVAPSFLFAPYFNYLYARDHGFVDWMLFGEVAATAESFAWPYFVWKKFVSNAEPTDADAQDSIGVKYLTGQGVPQDDVEAARWFRKAAEQGSAYGENDLGYMYAHGRGVTQDYADAIRLFRKAADKGLADAQNNLAGMYDAGRGVSQSDGEALRWFRAAADQGFALAQYNVGIMYANGQGVPRDDIQAYMWLELAIKTFTSAEGERRAKALKSRDAIAFRMSPDQIVQAQNLAREWKRK